MRVVSSAIGLPSLTAVVVAVLVAGCGCIYLGDARPIGDVIPISEHPHEAALPLLSRPSIEPTSSWWRRVKMPSGGVQPHALLSRGFGGLATIGNVVGAIVLLLLTLAIAAVAAIGTFGIPCAVPILLIRDRLSWQLSLGLSSSYYPIVFIFVAAIGSFIRDRPGIQALLKTTNSLIIGMFMLVTLPSILVPLYLQGDAKPIYGGLIGLWITSSLAGLFAYLMAPDPDSGANRIRWRSIR